MTQVDALEAVMQALETSDAAVRDSLATEPIARAFPLRSPAQSAVRVGELLKQVDACGGDQSNKVGPRLLPNRLEMRWLRVPAFWNTSGSTPLASAMCLPTNSNPPLSNLSPRSLRMLSSE